MWEGLWGVMGPCNSWEWCILPACRVWGAAALGSCNHSACLCVSELLPSSEQLVGKFRTVRCDVRGHWNTSLGSCAFPSALQFASWQRRLTSWIILSAMACTLLSHSTTPMFGTCAKIFLHMYVHRAFWFLYFVWVQLLVACYPWARWPARHFFL